MKNDPGSPTRREFLKTASAAATAAALGPAILRAEAGEAPPTPMVGIQAGAVSFVDEGTGKVLDILQERGAVNTVFVAAFTYSGKLQNPKSNTQENHKIQTSISTNL
jgi:hypothetical protein